MPSPKSALDKLKILKRLAAERAAAKPVVKEASQPGGELIKEGQSPEGQKFVQMLKKVAGIGGVVGAASLSQEEANAAGVETIAKKLGVALEEAKKIKDLAKTKISPDLFEENIRAIQEVSNYKKNPELYKRIDSGVDYRALQSPSGKVLKEPKDLTEPNEILQIAPGLMEQAGLGPKTKMIQVGERPPYMVQDKVTPLDKIIKSAQRPGGDPVLESLYKQHDELWKNVPKDKLAEFGKSPENIASYNKILNRQHEILKEKGIDPVLIQKQYAESIKNPWMQARFENEGIRSLQDALENPEIVSEVLFEQTARNKLGDVINPKDLHSANIGLTPEGKMTGFDTSRFNRFKPEILTPEQVKAIEDSNIALPEKKKALQALLRPENMKKAAAVAPLVSPDMFMSQGASQLGQAYSAFRQPVVAATQKVGEKVADIVRPPIPLSETQKEQERTIAGGITSMALDPINIVSPGLGAAMGAADVAAPDEFQSLMDILRKPKNPESEK